MTHELSHVVLRALVSHLHVYYATHVSVKGVNYTALLVETIASASKFASTSKIMSASETVCVGHFNN